uniref:Uncharacterized protein n=1 Tax=Glossina austeni TaxID=7395 RepID=A0A1A9VC65_GLOAU
MPQGLTYSYNTPTNNERIQKLQYFVRISLHTNIVNLPVFNSEYKGSASGSIFILLFIANEIVSVMISVFVYERVLLIRHYDLRVVLENAETVTFRYWDKGIGTRVLGQGYWDKGIGTRVLGQGYWDKGIGTRKKLQSKSDDNREYLERKANP